MNTVDQINQEILRLCKEKPDHINLPVVVKVRNSTIQRCSYTSGPNGPCLFGQALINLGIKPPRDDKDISQMKDVDAPPWWDWIQHRQDQGAAWGSLVEDIEKYMKEES